MLITYPGVTLENKPGSFAVNFSGRVNLPEESQKKV
jgi:hypothetical protein